jgi:Predicted xylanase/chitin deacetylase
MKITGFLKCSKKNNIFLFGGLLIITALVLTLLDYKASTVFSQTKKKVPIYSVEVAEKKVAISFDTSWGVDNTIEILNVLDKNNVKGTFFLIGVWIDKYPSQAKAIFDRGHDIGNHSNSHPDMKYISKEKVVQEIAITDAKIIKLTGDGTKLFRFPSGSYSDDSILAVEETKHIPVQWDVDSIDWKEQGVDVEYERVIKKTRPGSIMLFHNGAKYTPETLDKVIKELKSQGYQFVKVSDLIYKEKYYIDSNGRQILN